MAHNGTFWEILFPHANQLTKFPNGQIYMHASPFSITMLCHRLAQDTGVGTLYSTIPLIFDWRYIYMHHYIYDTFVLWVVLV